jgi:hypothetical protein
MVGAGALVCLYGYRNLGPVVHQTFTLHSAKPSSDIKRTKSKLDYQTTFALKQGHAKVLMRVESCFVLFALESSIISNDHV